jgi:5-methylcytosine-specific restriction endonuclease McrA
MIPLPRTRLNAATCKHASTSYRRFTLSNGTYQIRVQCDDCGMMDSSAVARSKCPISPDLLKPIDESARQAAQVDISKHWSDASERKKAEEKAAWLKEHDEYLRTPEWKAKRDKVLTRDRGICQGCLESSAVHVHHLTYRNWKNELLFQLTSLCRKCHEQAHQEAK